VAAERPRFGFWALWWLTAIFSLWLRTGFPPHALSFLNFDDELFIRGARYLGSGEWLCPYDNLTLAKGMFYDFSDRKVSFYFCWLAAMQPRG
jgi:hypothetical protein